MHRLNEPLRWTIAFALVVFKCTLRMCPLGNVQCRSVTSVKHCNPIPLPSMAANLQKKKKKRIHRTGKKHSEELHLSIMCSKIWATEWVTWVIQCIYSEMRESQLLPKIHTSYDVSRRSQFWDFCLTSRRQHCLVFSLALLVVKEWCSLTGILRVLTLMHFKW